MPNNRKKCPLAHGQRAFFAVISFFYSIVTMGITMGLRLVCLNR